MAERAGGPLLFAALLSMVCANCTRAGFDPPTRDGGATTVPLGATAVALGRYHACAITAAGGVKCWGANSDGQLGDGTGTDSPYAVDVAGLDRGVLAVATGESTTCALLDSTGVKCWGANGYGQLGDGSNSGRSAAGWVTGMESGLRGVDLGYGHACALFEYGGVKCWGKNYEGQVGDGTTDLRNTPVDVVGLGSGVREIAVGSYHACAVLDDGSARCWGANGSGQLGDTTTTTASVPVAVLGLSGPIQSISAGDGYTCAVLESGQVVCWGANSRGQLGNGTTSDCTHPVDVGGLSGSASAVATGWTHSCALLADGGVQCWGDNWAGQLGTGATSISGAASHVVGLAGHAISVGVSYGRSCAALEDGRVQCWGSNQYGALGNGTVGLATRPLASLAGGPALAGVAGGSQHTCVLTVEGEALCSGYGACGQIGDGNFMWRGTFVAVRNLGQPATALTAGGNFSCALGGGGGLRCWGSNGYGQLGNLGGPDMPMPVDVVGLTSGVIAVAGGGEHACAVASGGGVKCWGANSEGQLGDSSTTSHSVPTDVYGLSSGARGVACGGSGVHSCAVLDDGSVKCWGSNGDGQLGDGTTTGSTIPVDVGGLPEPIGALSAGDDHTCALTRSGAVRCWGYGGAGQIGNGYYSSSGVPTAVIGLEAGVLAIASGNAFNCALLDDGRVKCWGGNSWGQLGDGTRFNRTAPAAVVDLPARAIALSAGDQHACAVIEGGALYCWGDNSSGQLGVNAAWSVAPVDVLARP